MRVVMRSFAALLLLATVLFATAFATTSYSGLARSIVWMDADVRDYTRFPSRLVHGPTEEGPSLLRPPSARLDALPLLDRFNTLEPAGSDGFIAFLEDSETTAFVVAQRNRIVYEGYFNGADSRSWLTSFSVAKSIVSTLVGIEIEKGSISLDGSITEWIPELLDRDEAFDRITIRHLLTMSSGLRFEERGLPWSDDAETYYGTDLRNLAIEDTEVIEPPGQTFHYNPYNTILLGLILERATESSISELTERNLWQPLAAEFDASWSLDSEGGFEKMESGFNARARDYVRFGLLMMNGGRWENRQIVPKRWAKLSTAVEDRTDPSTGYGYHWWTDRDEAVGDWFLARGNKGQFVAVFPEVDVVVARFGIDFNYERWPELFPRVAEIAAGS